MRSEQEVEAAIRRYADMVRRICMLHLKNTSDTEDIFQEVFLKYALHCPAFQTKEHEKAWLIRVTINQCKDLLKSMYRSRTVSMEELGCLPDRQSDDAREVLEALLSLPPKYKDAVYLHYYEGYSAVEVGRMLHKNTNTVYTLLARAKKRLQAQLGGDADV